MTQRRFHRLGKDGESLEKGWKWIRQRFRERPLSSLLVAVGLLFLLVTVANTVRLGGTGFEPKTLWDWMDLLLVPLVLAIGGWWLNKTQKDSEREQAEKNREEDRRRAEQQAELERQIARERREQETLEQYFDRMTELLLKWDLREKAETDEESEVRSLARSRTLAVLRNLGPERRGNVIQFLYESNLISDRGNGTSTIDLAGADLSGAQLSWANLTGVNLRNADLSRAELIGANLAEADLTKADLSSADLTLADLMRANLIWAKLGGANLETADLSEANLTWASLRGANLADADLSGADLTRTDLIGANLETAELYGADLREAKLIEVDEIMISFNLGGRADLNGATYNDHTMWPTRFDPKAAGAILADEYGNPIEEPGEE